MHPLHNGSQVTERPARKTTSGTMGYFSESNDNNAPSYPGADFFNDQIDEFKNALAAMSIAYDETKVDHLAKLFESVSRSYPVYNPTTVYTYGDVVQKTIGGVKKFFQWYSNIESLAGKDPELDENRQTGWIDDTKPFYWTPLKGSRPGTPLWPWMSMTFPEGTLNVVGNSVPKAVFWRLAEAFPEFINGDFIDFPETGGEFFRVLDQGRGVDTNRVFSTSQSSQYIAHQHALGSGTAGVAAGGSYTVLTAAGSGASTLQSGGTETRPRNLAFPVLVEV
ncbi:hypothetical protein NMS86_000998 [Vibrio cholerae]|nr:hypothetical protein [Vibrio cholerae]